MHIVSSRHTSWLCAVAGGIPREATVFLIVVSVGAVLLLLFFLYINKALCFRLCPNLSSLFAGRLRRLSVAVKQTSSGRLSQCTLLLLAPASCTHSK